MEKKEKYIIWIVLALFYVANIIDYRHRGIYVSILFLLFLFWRNIQEHRMMRRNFDGILLTEKMMPGSVLKRLIPEAFVVLLWLILFIINGTLTQILACIIGFALLASYCTSFFILKGKSITRYALSGDQLFFNHNRVQTNDIWNISAIEQDNYDNSYRFIFRDRSPIKLKCDKYGNELLKEFCAAITMKTGVESENVNGKQPGAELPN